MKQKELNIIAPEGYEIDEENSTFEKIVFKKSSQERWRDNLLNEIKGFYIDDISDIIKTGNGMNVDTNYNVFATEKQAKSALAMARISQIMANDKRFGGPVSDKEWRSGIPKFIIYRAKNRIETYVCCDYEFLAFHTRNQRDLFLEENEDLVKDYLMVD